MITVKELKKLLKQFPDSASCYAYEGEICGVVITLHGEELGYILMGEGSNYDDGEIVIKEMLKLASKYK